MNTIYCIVDCIFQKGFYCSPKLFLVLFVSSAILCKVFLLKCSFYKVDGFLLFLFCIHENQSSSHVTGEFEKFFFDFIKFFFCFGA